MNINSTRVVRVLLLAATALLLASCMSSNADLRQWVAQQKARKGAPLPPLPVVKTFETFVYQDQDKRDPFAPPRSSDSEQEGGAAQGPRPDPDRVKEPLESFPLDSLKMVGTIGQGAGLRALVEDPQGVIHRVRKGDYAGKNYGHITSITPGAIELVELVPNGNGGWREREAEIKLGGENP